MVQLFESRLEYEEMELKNPGKKLETHIFNPSYRDDEFDEIMEITNHIVFNSFNQWKKFKSKVKEFEEFFDIPLNKVYGLEFRLLQVLGFLTRDEEGYKMTLKGAFYYHYYENFYTLSYIDKMWGIMRKEAFPKGMRL